MLAALGLVTGLWMSAQPARADALGDVQQLAASGKLAEAQSRLDKLIATNPKDPQYLFLRGVLLTEQRRTADAIKVFTQITEQFPELPEPYNNLAVLYAQQGQFDKARGALEMAIRTNPSYATAFENLGDVYAKLASQSYQKALQLNSGNGDATEAKLALIRQLFTAKSAPAGAAPSGTAPASAAPATVAAAKPAPRPVVAPAPQPAPAVKPAPQPVAPPKVASTKPTPSVPAVSTAAAPADDADTAAVESAVRHWAKAWSDKSLDAYFASYSPTYAPAGQRHSAWVSERRARIADKGHIEVELEQLHVKVEGDKAIAKFRQIYSSGSLHFNSPKTLRLEKMHGHWRIVQEGAS